MLCLGSSIVQGLAWVHREAGAINGVWCAIGYKVLYSPDTLCQPVPAELTAAPERASRWDWG